MADVQLFIGGRWRDGSGAAGSDIVNPATEERIGRVAHATVDDLDAAIAAARSAAGAWGAAGGETRAEILGKAATLLARRVEEAATALTLEQGKTYAEARAELARAVETFAWHAAIAATVTQPRWISGGASSIAPAPIGVVAAFTPWNYPAVIVARKLAAALAAGCPVVLKAAEETPRTAAIVVAALEEAGLPPGVVNLVFGDPPAIAAQLLDSNAVSAISFTGSTAVGKQLAARAAGTLKRCVLELGGHAPVLVCADAEIDRAVAAIAAYKFECAGQSCNAPGRLYVAEACYSAVVDRLVDVASRLRVGAGADPLTDMGPMANRRRVIAMERITEDARGHGGRILVGGQRLPRPGYFWPPTLVTDVGDRAALVREEAFGPILPINRFSTLPEAIARANANPYGLAAYLFTTSPEVARTASAGLEAGSIGVNELRGVAPDVGVSGIKDSGYGYEGGTSGIEAFLNLKVVRGTVAPAGRAEVAV